MLMFMLIATEWSLFSAFSERDFSNLTSFCDLSWCARACAHRIKTIALINLLTYMDNIEHRNLEVLCQAPQEVLYRPCVDCGKYTGRFCDFCLAVERVPSEQWANGQHTPLCSKCDERHACHFCLEIDWCQPFPHGNPHPFIEPDLAYTPSQSTK